VRGSENSWLCPLPLSTPQLIIVVVVFLLELLVVVAVALRFFSLLVLSCLVCPGPSRFFAS